MTKKTKEFEVFGVKYRTVQFSAVRGMEMMDSDGAIHPCDLLSTTEVLALDGEWKFLSSGATINECVIDLAGVLPPRMVLTGLSSVVYDFNFEFINDWKSAKIPGRFMDQSNSVSSANIDPMISQLAQDGVATLKELEEYYSLKDAFKLFDIIMVKGINQAISQESAMKKNKR